MDDSLLGRLSFVHCITKKANICPPPFYPSFLLGLKRIPTLFGTNLGGGGGGGGGGGFYSMRICMYSKTSE